MQQPQQRAHSRMHKAQQLLISRITSRPSAFIFTMTTKYSSGNTDNYFYVSCAKNKDRALPLIIEFVTIMSHYEYVKILPVCTPNRLSKPGN